MKCLIDLWQKLVRFFTALETKIMPVPEGFQPGMMPDELDSFEGWK